MLGHHEAVRDRLTLLSGDDPLAVPLMALAPRA